MFRDQEGYRKATVDAFRVFGVNIEGVPVTTSPAQKWRTVYVENREMRTGEDMVEAINKVIQPYYEVRRDDGADTGCVLCAFGWWACGCCC